MLSAPRSERGGFYIAAALIYEWLLTLSCTAVTTTTTATATVDINTGCTGTAVRRASSASTASGITAHTAGSSRH
jgi:hypothetical protein